MKSRAPCWVQLAALLLLVFCGCASAPAPKPAPAPSCDFDPAAVLAVVTHAIADACTARATDEFLIAHTDFLLKACHASISECLRRTCVRLGREDGEDEGITPAALRWPKAADTGLLVTCEKGGVAPMESHLASGWNCVLHDKSGSATSAQAISVYDDTMAVP